MLALALGLLALAAPAAAQEGRYRDGDFGGFRNVLPAGQGETVSAAELAASEARGEPPRSFTSQLPLYTELLYRAERVTRSDVNRLFKDASFGVPPGEVAGVSRPRADVEIVRDRTYNVPHVYGRTRSGTLFGAGYASAEDRLFLMDVLRHTGRARLTELIGPGDDNETVRSDAEQLKIADYSEQELEGMIDRAVARAGAEGRQVKADLLAYVAGINQYIAEARRDPNKLPAEYPALGKLPQDWKPTDTVAVASLIGGIFGRGGGREADASQVLKAAIDRVGAGRARSVFRDFRNEEDPETPVTTARRFPSQDQGPLARRSLALPDLGSIKQRDPVIENSPGVSPGALPGLLEDLSGGLGLPGQQSNALLVSRDRSRSGRALAVMGPQVGYFSPQILMELDLHGPGIDARGAAFPGISLYILLGRGKDFAWSATTANTDNVDEFVERLCEPDGSPPTAASRHYRYKGRCRPFARREHVLQTTTNPTDPTTPPRTIRMEVLRSVHGPIQSFATVRGAPVAVAESRSTYMNELDSALAFKRLTGNEVNSIGSFQRTMAKVNFLFNWFYADDRDTGWLQSGWFPERARGTDPNLPAWGTGEWDWRGFDPRTFLARRLGFTRLPKDRDPSKGYIVNWNNKQAPGWRSGDDIWSFGAVQRVERLGDRLKEALRRKGKIGLNDLVGVMERGATVDLRGQENLPEMLALAGRSSDPVVADAVRRLQAWRRAGSHRRDLTRDNVYEHSPAVALMDAWWPRMVRAEFEPALGAPLIERIAAINPFSQQPDEGGSAFFDGWYGYVDKDLRQALGRPVRGRLSRTYCGGGSTARCAGMVASTLAAAVDDVKRFYRVEDLGGVRVPATCPREDPPRCDQIGFVTAGAVGTDPIPWQDRPTFQQVVEVAGHRPRRAQRGNDRRRTPAFTGRLGGR